MVFKVIAISGSLQKASTNTGLLKACQQIKNSDLDIQIVDISNFPHLNPDLIENGKFPGDVQTIRNKVSKADAVLFAIPQYNYRVSGVFKNAYDWISMSINPQQKPSPFKQIPVGIMSSGLNGGNKAQEHFVQIGQYCKVKLMKQPTIQVKRYEPGNFDQHGSLTNQQVKKDLQSYLKKFVSHIEKNKK